jgi:cyanuric acid amidohydrolase
MSIDVIRFEMAAPDDVSHLRNALVSIEPQSISRLALIAKVEGTATINDYSRQLALLSFRNVLSSAGLQYIPQQIILSTGCEGVTTPGGYLIVQRPDKPSPFPALAFGIGASHKIPPHEMIGSGHCEAASQATSLAIADAGLAPEDVALVLIKSPVLTSAMVAAHPAASLARANSTALSRGVAALGAGLALGDILASEINADAITGRPDLHCSRAMAFSGTETDCCEAVVLGNRPGMAKSLRCGTMRDLIDLDGLASIICPQASDPLTAMRTLAKTGRIRASFLKAGAGHDGTIRGHRTTIFSSDLEPDKQMRAAASGVLAACLGDTRFFVSGGTEHQAPLGQCIFAALIVN